MEKLSSGKDLRFRIPLFQSIEKRLFFFLIWWATSIGLPCWWYDRTLVLMNERDRHSSCVMMCSKELKQGTLLKMKSKTQWYELTNCMNNKNLQQLRKLNLIDNGIVDLLVLLVNRTLQLEVEQRLDTSWMERCGNIQEHPLLFQYMYRESHSWVQ